jgi:hypothetical protein
LADEGPWRGTGLTFDLVDAPPEPAAWRIRCCPSGNLPPRDLVIRHIFAERRPSLFRLQPGGNWVWLFDPNGVTTGSFFMS